MHFLVKKRARKGSHGIFSSLQAAAWHSILLNFVVHFSEILLFSFFTIKDQLIFIIKRGASKTQQIHYTTTTIDNFISDQNIITE